MTRIPSTSCLSVVIPAFNEETTIETVTRQVLNLSQVLEVIIVDDGSTDATPAICDRLALLSKVRVLRLPRNQRKRQFHRCRNRL